MFSLCNVSLPISNIKINNTSQQKRNFHKYLANSNKPSTNNQVEHKRKQDEEGGSH
jgi:hypothetical protein